MTYNKSLKRRIKEYMRENECGVTAHDIPKKFDRKMSLEQSIIFLQVLEQEDRVLTSQYINDTEGLGVDKVYYYIFKERKRGVRE